MSGWFLKQYNDIKGNAKWALLGIFWTVIVTAAQFILKQIPHLPNWGLWGVVGLISVIAFVWLAKSQPSKRGIQVAPVTQELATNPGVPVQQQTLTLMPIFVWLIQVN